jgi:hypothetical protein
MWHPPDPDEPTSELYRLMPPRRRSEIREALDAATGSERQAGHNAEDSDEVILSGPADGNVSWHARPWVRWTGGVATALLVTIVGTVVASLLYGWLASSPSPPAQPAPTAQPAHRTSAAPSRQGRP